MADSSAPLLAIVGRPAARACESAGYRAIADLEGASERQLLALHGLGPRAIKILRCQGPLSSAQRRS
ncbi:DNA-binding protein [Pengzhenrongella frigida]|uniref:DNA-binding protein n=1 Tax=Pengzhenrongella frigida TaxID=1259133 RepID=A0A4Q5N6M8_9MICO|nr:DNA-binding protein [Cellulomonas sp. HLT2-17]